MKLKFHHPEPKEGELVGPRYWRSLDELADKPDFQEWLHREFPAGASEATGVNRRNFLKIMSASFAAAGVGLAGCRRPEHHILPYSRQTGDTMPERAIPGIPVHYTTAFPDSIDSLPLIVETHQNRPTHIEGNGDYVPYGGGTSAVVQASILDLYDPDRMTSAYEGRSRRLRRAQVADRLRRVNQRFSNVRGQGLAVLARPSSSPTRARLKAEFLQRFPRAVWSEYEPVARDTAERAATELFGTPVRPLYRLAKARRIVAIDADFLCNEAGSNQLARDYARVRKVSAPEEVERMNRLYAVESNMTVSGGMADHRLRLSASEMSAFIAQLAAEVLEQTGGNAGLARTLRQRSGQLAVDPAWITECARDLVAHRGQSVILVGSHLPVITHVLAMLANEALGASGQTVEYVAVPAREFTPISELADAMRQGRVETLVIVGGNPAYDAPADLDFSALLQSVPEVIRYGYHFDETSIESQINIAATHYLESWGDARAYDGTYLPVQPMILPLFDSWQEPEFLATLAGTATLDPYAIVFETFQGLFGGGERDFQRLLSTGFQENSAFTSATPAFPFDRVRTLANETPISAPNLGQDSLEVLLVKDGLIGDGTYNNNGWLQECPDPITKLSWDNAILVSPRLAEEVLGYNTKSGEFLIGGIARRGQDMKRGREIAPMVEVTLDGVSVRGPVHIQPGLADWTIVMPLGFGRRQVGRVGRGTGFDAYPLSASGTLNRVGARIAMVTGETYRLANTQEHWSMEGRAIVREANADYFVKNPEWVSQMGMESHSPAIYARAEKMSRAQKALETPRGGGLYETPDFGAPPRNADAWQSPEARERFIPEQQWGMSVDLNTCTGCNACVIACQSENNIPIVGKDQVMRGREMHWIRLDRYYSSGDQQHNQVSLPRDPQVSLMPLACVHCEMAPCEQVCPVNATVHDSQGLNVMAYNRCVGTRYCSNNCPYKVRRFNFFDYTKRAADELYFGPVGTDQNKTEGGRLRAMRANPNVTVRSRGVMEKCTYCVQRIQTAKIAQKVKARDSNNVHVPDGVIKVACQSACPTQAIVFGDISDPDSAVSREKDTTLEYSLLGYLNTRPRTTYRGRLRNPNPAMPDYYSDALSRKEYKGTDAVEGGSPGSEHGHDAHSHG